MTASIAMGASMDWTMNYGRNGYAADKSGNKFTGTVYLLLTDSISGLSGFTSSSAFETALNEVALGSTTLTDGKNTDRQTATSSLLTAPNTYSVSVLFYDAANKAFYTSTSVSGSAYNLGGDTYGDAQGVTFSATNLSANSDAARAGVTWTPVPEPSTAALALAGLALLLKRRKA